MTQAVLGRVKRSLGYEKMPEEVNERDLGSEKSTVIAEWSRTEDKTGRKRKKRTHRMAEIPAGL